MNPEGIDYEAEAEAVARADALFPRCTHCHHGPHPERRCLAAHVGGPPARRRVQPCECTRYETP